MPRIPAADSFTEIAKRIQEIQAERMQAIAGCVCPADLAGEINHTNSCPLRPLISVHIGPATTLNEQHLTQQRHHWLSRRLVTRVMQ